MDRLLSMKVFERVATEGGFAAAARALDLSPAAVTRLVADLEAHLGTRLLQRSTRRVSLTEAGEAFRHLLRIEEEHHRRPAHGAVTMLVDEVDDHRQQGERQPDEEDGLEEAHRAVREVLGFRPRRNRARTWS